MRWIQLILLIGAIAAFAPSDARAQRFGGRSRGGAGEQRSQPEKFKSAPKDPDGWVGMKIMPRTPTATLAVQGKPNAFASAVSPWPQTVRKVNGSWLWIETPDASGWIHVRDVVPLADAILYFNARIARQTNAWDLYMRGSVLRDQERFAETYKDFKALEKLEEKQLAVLEKQADALAKKKDYRALIVTATRMARLAPGNVTIFIARGAAFAALKDIARAQADFDHAVELAASTATYSARSAFYREQGDLPRAIDDLDKAIYHWPLVRLHEDRAKCLILNGEHERAIDDLNIVLAYDPTKVENYLLRARAQLASGHVYQANLDFSAAIQLAPKAETYEQAAMMRYMCKDFRRAVDDATMAIRLNPRRPESYLVRGDSLAKLGRDDEAMTDLSRAIQLNPRESRAYLQRGQLAFKLKNPEMALRDGVEAYRLGNRSDACLLLTGLGYLVQGATSRCTQLMDEALRAKSGFSQMYTLRSVAAWLEGNDARAQDDALEARLRAAAGAKSDVTLELTTDVHRCPPVECRQAVFLSDLGMQKQADALATRLIAKFPQSGSGYYARGMARARLYDFAAAAQDLEKAVELDPTNDDTYRILTHCEFELDRHDALIAHATQWLAIAGPVSEAFSSRAWAWHSLREAERTIEDISDAMTYRDESTPERIATWHMMRSEAHKRLGHQAEADADRQQATAFSHSFVSKWDAMIREENERRNPSLFVHSADGDNLRSSTKSADSSREKKKREPWEEEFSFREKDEKSGKKWPKLGTPPAFR